MYNMRLLSASVFTYCFFKMKIHAPKMLREDFLRIWRQIKEDKTQFHFWNHRYIQYQRALIQRQTEDGINPYKHAWAYMWFTKFIDDQAVNWTTFRNFIWPNLLKDEYLHWITFTKKQLAQHTPKKRKRSNQERKHQDSCRILPHQHHQHKKPRPSSSSSSPSWTIEQLKELMAKQFQQSFTNFFKNSSFN